MDYVADIKAMIEMMVEDLGPEEAGAAMMDACSTLVDQRGHHSGLAW